MKTNPYLLAAMALAILQATGCTIKGTINEITDTTSNVTVSTSGAAWWNEDGQIRSDFKAAAFAAANSRNLEQDIATGRGEYLTSMSVLLGVPEDQRPTFFSIAQARYAEAARQPATTPERWQLFLQRRVAELQ